MAKTTEVSSTQTEQKANGKNNGKAAELVNDATNAALQSEAAQPEPTEADKAAAAKAEAIAALKAAQPTLTDEQAEAIYNAEIEKAKAAELAKLSVNPLADEAEQTGFKLSEADTKAIADIKAATQPKAAELGAMWLDSTKTEADRNKILSELKAAEEQIAAISKTAKAAFDNDLTARKIDRVKLYITDKLGITVEQLNAAIESDKAMIYQPLRNGLSYLFGGKITVAAQGQTGASLSGSAKPAATTDGSKPSGSTSKEIADFLSSGTVTKAALLAAYPTKDNPSFLNGTARTVVSKGQWKVNPITGFYQQVKS